MREFSFGILPLQYINKKWRILLVRHGKGHWSFPKGHAEVGEGEKECAERELFEETGLKVKAYLPLNPFKESYSFHWEGKRIHKTVLYYAALVEGEITLQQEEISAAEWLSLELAKERATFKEGQLLLEQIKSSLGSLVDPDG